MRSTVLAIASVVLLVAWSSVPAQAQELTGDWILEVGTAEVPVQIEQQNNTLTVRLIGGRTEVLRGTYQGGRIEVSREPMESDYVPSSATPECQGLLRARAAQLRGDPTFRRFIYLEPSGPRDDMRFTGRYQLQPELHCTNEGQVRIDPARSEAIVLRPAFPPFDLRFVTKQGDAFRPADEARLGGEIYVEAVFKGRPKEATFEVSLSWDGGAKKVTVSRTVDPLVYRSGPLRLKSGAPGQ